MANTVVKHVRWTIKPLLRCFTTTIPLQAEADRHATRSHDARAGGPLQGVTICDMTRILAGPYCTMVLGDMGADVLKIERPGVGDETRRWGPPFIGGESVYNMSINRNKRSVCVDVQSEEGKEIVYGIVANSDVFIENFIHGKLDALGYGYDKLSSINPQLIYCSINGFGSRGEYKTKPGYDLVANAVGGLLHITGPEGGDPCRPGVAAIDILTGLYAHTAITAALYERTTTGRGKKIDVSLFQSQVAALSYHGTNYLNQGIEAVKRGASHCSIVPSGSFDAKDGEIVLSASDDVVFERLVCVLGCLEIISDSRFKTNASRVEHRDALDAIISECVLQNTIDYWLQAFGESGVPCARINNIHDAMCSAEVKALNNVHSIPHSSCGDVKVVGPAVKFDGQCFPSPPLPPPSLGQHTEEVLAKL